MEKINIENYIQKYGSKCSIYKCCSFLPIDMYIENSNSFFSNLYEIFEIIDTFVGKPLRI